MAAMAPVTRFVLAHKRLVVLFWLAVTIAGMAFAGRATDALRSGFSVPNREGSQTNAAIRATYGGGGNDTPLVPVVTLPAGTRVDSPAVRKDLREVANRIEGAVPGTRVASYATTGDRAFVSRDGRTTFMLAYQPPGDDPFGGNAKGERAARAALRGATVAGAPVHLTGLASLQADAGDQGGGPGVLAEAVVGGLGALAVLAFVFASLMAFVPLLIAVVSIMTSFLAVWGLTAFTDISPIVAFLIALIGLGVAIDYALLMVVRWREERAHGLAGNEAIVAASRTAGRTVVFSGTTVAVGLLALIALPLPFLSSVGYGGMLIPLASVAVTITLLPAILAKAGPRLDWPHARTEDRASRAWTRWARFVVRRRWAATVAALAVLGGLVFASTTLQFGTNYGDPDQIAKSGGAEQGLVALERSGIGSGVLTPIEVLTDDAASAGVARDLTRVDGVHAAFAPDGPGWRRAGRGLVEVLPSEGFSSQVGRDTLDRVHDAAHASSSSARVGGNGAQQADFIDAVYGNFPLMIALIAVITFVLLARAFRSLLLPAKAIALNVLSIGAAWGLVALVWQHGFGSDEIWGIAATGSLPPWIPLMIFAFLFGLSMDYEVFILARMREEYDRTGSTDEAVVHGIGRTGRLVTSAALILFLAFLALASGPEPDVKKLATGLAGGILLDATVIRALLVPALMKLLGNANWWIPGWLGALLRVKHPEPTPKIDTPPVPAV
jgi:putative drug exporter of the RND superfamily